VRADNVRSALAFVERGEASAGIVYATDARVSHKVRVLARFPAASHPPIVYPAALVAGASGAARQVYARLFMPPAQAALREAGFEPVP
jgi:molybdate transport system substrate-binding protein